MMESLWCSVVEKCAPVVVVLARCGRKRSSKYTIGALLLAFLLRQFCALRRRQHLKKLIQRRQQELKDSRARLELKYPNPTPKQAAVAALDLPDIKEKLRDGSLTVEEVVESFIAKAVDVNRSTDAVVEIIEDALTRAKALDSLPMEARGPLHGIPVSLKEHIELEGQNSNLGIPSLLEKRSEQDAELVRVLKLLGAVPFCRTNLPQTCLSFECSNPIFGVTKNPRDPKRGPGGSSGGEGALIGGGGSIIGVGSDVGGSVRIPAAFSGICSLKPTAGRLPLRGQANDGGLVGVVGLYNSLGFMGRSPHAIEECMREVLDDKVVSKVRDARFVPLAWNDEKAANGRKLRIGWYDYDGCFETTPGIKRAVSEAVSALSALGHEVVPFRPAALPEVVGLYGKLLNADGGECWLPLLRDGPVDMRAMWLFYRNLSTPVPLKKVIRPLVALKSPMLAETLTTELEAKLSKDLWKLSAYRLELVESVLKQWEESQIDIIVAPGFAMPAQPLGFAAYQIASISYTCAYNLLNFPVGSLPVSEENAGDQLALKNYPGRERDLVYGWVKDGTRGAVGMPLNVQVIGRPWNEEMVARVMKEIHESVKK